MIGIALIFMGVGIWQTMEYLDTKDWLKGSCTIVSASGHSIVNAVSKRELIYLVYWIK